MSQNFSWPTGFAAVSIPYSGLSGNPVPLYSALMGGLSPTNTLLPVAVDASGRLLLAISGVEIGEVQQGDPNTNANGWPVKITDGTNVLGTAANPIRIDPTGTTTQPVSMASAPLPTGAATEATLSALNAKVVTVDTSAVTITSSALPTGAATEATLSTMNTKIPAGLTVTSTRLLVDGSGVTQPVSGTVIANQGTSPWVTSVSGTVAVTQSGVWNITDITGTISLPTGAATAANQATEIASLSSIDGKIPSGLTVTSTRLLVDGSGVTQPVSGTITANQGGTWNINNISGTISLPTGAAEDATLARLTLAQASTTSGQFGPLVQGAVTTSAPSYTTAQTSPLSLTTAGALRTDSSATTQPISAVSIPSSTGRSRAIAPITNTYSSVNITTSAYTQLVASTGDDINEIHIFDSSGQAMILAVGGAGSEVDQAYIAPGGEIVPLRIPSGSRISYKALSANATAGYLTMSFFK